ncbi:MAG: hypothetical protein ABI353_22230 [Isosphaeraceae bacterium]
MTQIIDVRPTSAPPVLTEGARGLVRWVCTSNPFYAISALMVIMGLWISFGAQIRAEQTWALMFGLAGYTLLLAVTACLLVRFGGVWDDVRTVLLLVVLMFLATSVTFDEALARSPVHGASCYLVGWLFATTVSEGMLRGMRLGLPPWFRGPYYLILSLFFLYPLGFIPLLDLPRSEALEWLLFGFSTVAGLVFLTLLPAIRRGPDYVRDNGSPWRWPLYPWALFVFLGFGVAARAFLLCWSMQHIERTEPERYIFGPYFLVPFGLAIAVLLLEIGLVRRSRRVLWIALTLPMALVVLSMVGHRPDPLYQGFLDLFRARLGGTPLFLTVLAMVFFSIYASIRRVPRATEVLTAALAMLSVIGPGSLDLNGLVSPRTWPLLAIAVLQTGLGLRRHDAWRCLVGASGLVLAASISLGNLEGAPARTPIAFHLILLAVLTIGAVFNDRFGRSLRTPGALLVFLACLASASGRFERPDALPEWVMDIYPFFMAALLAGYGAWLRHRPSMVVAPLIVLGGLGAAGWRGYCVLRQVVLGLDQIALGLASFGLAALISLAKSGALTRWWARKRKVPDPMI